SSLAVSSAPGGPLSTTACARFGSGSSGNGLAAWIWPSSSRVTTTTGAVTPSLAAIASLMARPSAAQSASSAALNSTFPLWMYVTTSACPSSPTSVRRSAIATLFLPPRLIPRSSATCVAMKRFFPARRRPLRISAGAGRLAGLGDVRQGARDVVRAACLVGQRDQPGDDLLGGQGGGRQGLPDR